MLGPDIDVLEGRYVYRLDGEPFDVDEEFQIARATDGFEIRSERRAVGAGVKLAVDAKLHDGRLVAGQFSWEDGEGGIRRAYQHEDEPDALINGLLRVFMGPLVLAIHEAGGEANVLTPCLSAEQGREALLGPERSVRKAWKEQQEWFLQGGPYGGVARCTLNANGLLEQYQWLQDGVGQWLVQMEVA